MAQCHNTLETLFKILGLKGEKRMVRSSTAMDIVRGKAPTRTLCGGEKPKKYAHATGHVHDRCTHTPDAVDRRDDGSP